MHYDFACVYVANMQTSLKHLTLTFLLLYLVTTVYSEKPSLMKSLLAFVHSDVKNHKNALVSITNQSINQSISQSINHKSFGCSEPTNQIAAKYFPPNCQGQRANGGRHSGYCGSSDSFGRGGGEEQVAGSYERDLREFAHVRTRDREAGIVF